MKKRTAAIIKRDLRSNWKKSNYVPDINVIIIMDNEDGTISLMLGDGESNVNELPDLLNDKPFSRASVTEESVLVL